MGVLFLFLCPQSRLNHPAGGIPHAGAGGERQYLAVHCGHHSGADDGALQGGVDEGAAAFFRSDLRRKRRVRDPGLPGGEDVIIVDAPAVDEADLRVLLPCLLYTSPSPRD